MKKQSKPIHEIRLGHIKAAFWKNETEVGVRYNATLSRIYREENQWKSTKSFGRDDLLLVAKVADQAHSWIFAQTQNDDSGLHTNAPDAEDPTAQLQSADQNMSDQAGQHQRLPDSCE